jgi:alkanesulfonate monooxygenase SsuD/methylene tetrahydromethanopterin reductase-like flavin-dependent oxidoreductase (luciferase family)
MAEADERFEEGLALILKSWTCEERFSHHGKYWHFEDIIVEPPTAQKPHPPIWMAAGSPDSIRKVAERGYGLMLDQFALPETILERFNLFKAEVEKLGRAFDPMTVAVARAFYVARDAADKAKAIENRLAATRRMTNLAQTPAGDSKSSMVSFADTREASERSAMFGSPDEIATKLEMFRDAGITNILLNNAMGSRDHLRRFAREVMPAFSTPAKMRVASG